jgi:PAS domain S-box-containing protein
MGERRYELLLNAISDYAIYWLDEDGYVSSWNTGAQRFKGYLADEIIGRHFSCFYTDEDRAAGLPQNALRVAAEKGSFESEGWRVRKDGTRFWTGVTIDAARNAEGVLIGYAKITRDLTEKLAAEKALYASEQRFRMLVQGVRDYAIYMLDTQGYISNWNTGAQSIKGYTEDEIVGQHFSRFYVEEDRERGVPRRALDTAIRDGRFENEAWRVRKDGSRFWAHVIIDPILDVSGALVGFAKITRDITEQRRTREELEKSRETLAQAQKLEAIGRLTGGVAHDFNNLLTIIRGAAELLRRATLTEEKRARYISSIADASDRAALLTRQLLAFARQQPLRPELFDVESRIRGLAQMMETTVGSPVKLELAFAPDLPAVCADPNQFETAVLNIVINARDAMPEGGTLRISANEVDAVPAVRRHARVAGRFIAVTVEDSGTGIDPVTLERIFEPFFTSKPVNKGTGLGLSQAYGFAKQSGGEIAVKTAVGVGTAFTLYLPHIAGVTEAAAGPAAAEPIVVEPRNVLLVEDNETVGEFARDVLIELGHRVTWVTDGETALRLLDARRTDFDLVFSDVVMPGLNGIELGREVRRRWPDLRVVLASGYSHVLAAQNEHEFELLEKPYSMNALLGILLDKPDTSGGAHGQA